jgi:hypothetical protein
MHHGDGALPANATSINIPGPRYRKRCDDAILPYNNTAILHIQQTCNNGILEYRKNTMPGTCVLPYTRTPVHPYTRTPVLPCSCTPVLPHCINSLLPTCRRALIPSGPPLSRANPVVASRTSPVSLPWAHPSHSLRPWTLAGAVPLPLPLP